MEKKYFNELKNILRTEYSDTKSLGIVALCLDYLKYITYEENLRLDESIKYVTDNDIIYLIKKYLCQFNKYKLDRFYFSINTSKNDICSDISNLSYKFGEDNSTPDYICDLVKNLLDINGEDSILDFGSGMGNFTVKNYSDTLGVDIDRDMVAIAKIRCNVMGVSANVIKGDILGDKEYAFDKIFVDIPSLSIKSTEGKNTILSDFKRQYPDIKLTSSDWLFAYSAIKNVKSSGKVAIIVSNGSLVNRTERAAREYFVKNGYVESVIMLADVLGKRKNVNIVVLNKTKSPKIKFVDARDIFTVSGKKNILSEQNITDIMSLVNSRFSLGQKSTSEVLDEENVSLSPDRYMAKSTGKGIIFKDIITGIKRGAPITSEELSRIQTTKKTTKKYLMLSDISDGIVSDNLMGISSVPEKYTKYILKNGDILLSKNGYPFKVAVADFAGQEVLPSGNFYVISINNKKANPYYVKLFLQSEAGQELFKSVMVGSQIKTISVSSLENLILNLPNVYEQNLVAEEYRDIEGDIKKLLLQIDNEKTKIKKLVKIKK